MANDVVIKITGQDGVTQTFRKIGSEADRMGRDVDQAADRGGRSLDRLSKAGAAVGAIFSVVQGAVSDAARASEESAQVQRQLEQAIANTGDSYAVYAERIAAAGDAAVKLGIDDEKAAQAIQALTEITGDAGTALDLLGTAQDLAAAKGLDLVSAAELVGRVHEGNVGILKRYSVVVSEGATAEQALAEIQAQTAGQAEAHATVMARLNVQFGNLQERAGELLGGLAPYLTVLPGISAGWSAMASGIGAVAPKLAALARSLGPAGVVGAAGLAAVGIVALVDALHTSFGEAASEARQKADDLATSIKQLAEAGDPRALIGQAWAADLEAGTTALVNFNQEMERLGSLAREAEFAMNDPGATQEQREAAAARLEAIRAEQEALKEQIAAFGDAKDAISAYGELHADLNDILANTGPAAEGSIQIAQGLINLWKTGQISTAEFTSRVGDLRDNLDDYNLLVIAAAEATNDEAKAQAEAAKATDEHKKAVASYGDALSDLIAPAAASTDTLTDIEHILGSTVPAADSARAALAAAFAELEAGDMPLAEFEGRANAISGSLDQVESRTRAMAEANRDAALALSGLSEVAPGTGQALLDLAAAHEEHDRLLREATGGYYGLMDGATSAKDALAAFKETQDRLLESQSVFNQQQSEYESQIRAIEAALDIINEKQAEGIALTKQEIDIRDRSTAALERLEGGVEDVTLASADLAIQYGENMEKGDALNQTLDENAGSAAGVEDAIRDLIEALHGIPGYVSAQIDANTAGAHAAVDGITSRLNALNNARFSVFIDVIQSGGIPDFGFTPVTGQDGLTAHYADGGTTRYGDDAYGAIRQLAHGGTLAWVGERGPELVTLPGGSQVMNTEGSRARARGGRGGVRFQNFGNITIAPNDPSRFGRDLRRQWAAEEARSF